MREKEMIDMDELVKLVAGKLGIADDKAKLAVETVVGFLKKKLPAPLASQIDGVLAGGGGIMGKAAGFIKGLGGTPERK
jgi:hypothetical protein